MENIIFIQKLKENKENPQFFTIVRELAYDFFKKELKENSQVDILESFKQMSEILRSEGLLNTKSISNLIQGLSEAKSELKEQYIYKLIYEKEQVEQKILDLKKQIRSELQATLESIEDFIQNSDFEDKIKILQTIDEKMLCDLQMLGILKESTEAAFLTALEHQEDIRDTIAQIAKNLVFNAINDDKIDKTRFLEVAEVVCETAVNIANIEYRFARWIIVGVLEGTRDGLVKAVEKFIDDIKYVPNSQSLLESSQEFIKIENAFVTMVRELMARSNEPAAGIINEILQSSLDSYFAKFRRMQYEISTQISLRLEELKGKENIDKFTTIAVNKFGELKRELSSNERLENLKKEIGEFEKKVEARLESINYQELGQNVKKQAKELGNKMYNAAKNLLERGKKE
jgi:hypothetical protein